MQYRSDLGNIQFLYFQKEHGWVLGTICLYIMWPWFFSFPFYFFFVVVVLYLLLSSFNTFSLTLLICFCFLSLHIPAFSPSFNTVLQRQTQVRCLSFSKLPFLMILKEFTELYDLKIITKLKKVSINWDKCKVRFCYSFYWRIVDLQCCVIFRCTRKWVSYSYMYFHYLFFFFILFPYRPLQSIE